VKFLTAENRPVWSRLSFKEAETNFYSAARSGLYSRQVWPKSGRVDISELVREVLAPRARRGLQSLDADPDAIDHYIGIIEERARTRQNGATWQLRTLNALRPRVTQPDSPERRAALAHLVELYITHQRTEKPVHTWPVGEA
jgi:hypothetical protein